MTEMRATPRTKNFGTFIAKFTIGRGRNIFLCDRLPEAGPAGAGFELRIGSKKIIAAADAGVYSFLVIIGILAGESSLGAFLAGHFIGKRLELLLPFGIGFYDFLDFDKIVFLGRKDFYFSRRSLKCFSSEEHTSELQSLVYLV